MSVIATLSADNMIAIQSDLLSLTSENFNSVLHSIIQLLSLETQDSFLFMLINTSYLRFKNAQIIAKLFASLQESISFFESLKKSLLSFVFKDFIHENMNETYLNSLFIRECIENGVFSAEEIVALIRKIEFKGHLFDFAFLFGPEIEKVDKNLLEDWIKRAKDVRSDVEYIHPTLIDHLEELRENNWMLLKEIIQKGNKFNELCFGIQHDDVEVVKKSEVNKFYYSSLERGFLTCVTMNALHYSVLYQSRGCVEFLSDKFDLSLKTSRGHNVAHFASAVGDLNLLKKFESLGVPLEGALPIAIWAHQQSIIDYLKGTYKMHTKENLIAAIDGNNIRVLKELAQLGIDFSQAISSNMTPVHYAAQTGNLISLQFLLSLKGADMNVLDSKNKQSALILAVSCGKSLVARFLVLAGCESNQKDKREESSLHYAAKFGNIDSLSALSLNPKTNFNVRNRVSDTPLTLAIHEKQTQAALWLIQRPDVKINLKNNAGFSPLHLASLEGFFEIVDALIKKDADINSLSKRKETALHLAVERKHLNIVQLLISTNKVDPTLANEKGLTVLHQAVITGDPQITEAVLSLQGIDVNACTESGESVFEFSLRNRSPVIANMLLTRPNINLWSVNKEKWTSLHFAAQNGFLEIAKILISQHPEGLNALNNTKKTALHLAAQTGNVEVVEFLLHQEGIESDRLDSLKCAPFHYACMNGHLAILKRLIKAELLNSGDVDGNTALHFAAMYDKADVAQFLLKYDVKVNIKNEDGLTPLQIAKEKCANSVIQVFGASGFDFQ